MCFSIHRSIQLRRQVRREQVVVLENGSCLVCGSLALPLEQLFGVHHLRAAAAVWSVVCLVCLWPELE